MPDEPNDHIQPFTRAERHALESLEELEPGGRRFSKRLIAVQILGGLVGAGILAAAIFFAFSEENAEALSKLEGAPVHLIATLVGLSIGTIVTWGLLFTATARPIARLHVGRTIAVNCMATFVAAVPFKLSLALRGLIHHKRDGVAIKDCLAWFTALSGLTLLLMAGLALLALWTREANATFFAGGVAWLVVLHGFAYVVSVFIEKHATRAEASDTNNAARWFRRLTLGATRITAHPGPLVVAGGLRVVEIGITAARFTVAAQLIGLELPLPDALILALVFSSISIVAPTGSLGLREGGTTAVAAAVGLTPESAALVALLVSAAELATAGVLAVPALVWVKPWRLVANRGT